MTKLSPSILSADFACLGSDCRQVLDAGSDMLHFDVMDGHFVPNISFGLPVLKSLRAAFPEAVLDVHLMISHPLTYVPAFAKAGASLITFHLESEDDPAETIRAIHDAGCGAGLALRPGTDVARLFPYLKELELALIMSVEPGFGGQKFQPEAAERLKALNNECRAQGVAPYLQVDGGIDVQTGARCVAAGANLLVAGSAVFGAPDRAAAVAALRAL